MEALYVQVNHDHIGNLIGRLLTLNDAFEQDPDARNAKKTLIKRECRMWLDDQAIDQQVEGWLLGDMTTIGEEHIASVSPPTVGDQVLMALASTDREWMTRLQIESAIGASSRAVHRSLAALEKDGHIESRVGGLGARSYRLVDGQE